MLGIYYLAQTQIDLSEEGQAIVSAEISKVSRTKDWKYATYNKGSTGTTARKLLDQADGGDNPNRSTND